MGGSQTRLSALWPPRSSRKGGSQLQVLPGLSKHFRAVCATLVSHRAVVGLSHVVKDFAFRGLDDHCVPILSRWATPERASFNPEDAPGIKHFLELHSQDRASAFLKLLPSSLGRILDCLDTELNSLGPR